MPLNFTEEQKASAPVEFFNPNSKSRPQHLEGEVIPELIKRVGDIKSGRLSISMVQRYLEKNVLIFDPDILKELFKEADYKEEGSLDIRSMAAALSGRYPKRRLTREWRQLVTLLLGTQELCLTEDIVHPKISNNGIFNGSSSWSAEPPLLPPIKKYRMTSKESRKDFTKSLDSADISAGSYQDLASTFLASRDTNNDSWLLTTSGVRNQAPSFAEMTVNKSPTEGGSARSTFLGKTEFDDFSSGMVKATQLSLSPAALKAMTARSWTDPKPGIRAWSSTLPPTGISMPLSSLEAMRKSVRSTMSSKPVFSTMFRSLGPCEMDLKKTLGEQMDVSKSMSRIEPTRPTETRFGSTFLECGDYAVRCRYSMPSAFFNEHPSLPAAAKLPTKYPWGELL